MAPKSTIRVAKTEGFLGGTWVKVDLALQFPVFGRGLDVEYYKTAVEMPGLVSSEMEMKFELLTRDHFNA